MRRRCLLLPLALMTLTAPAAPAQEKPAPALDPHQVARLLRDRDPDVRRRALAGLADGRAVPEDYRAVLTPALRDDDRQVRQFAAVALAASGLADRPVLDALIRAMGEREESPRYAPRPEGPTAAKQALTRLGARAVPSLVAALQDEQYPARHLVLDALADLGPVAKDALPALAQALAKGRGPEFVGLVHARWRIGGDAAAAVEELVPLLDTKEGRSCGGALTVLARMGPDGKGAVPAVIRAMKTYREGEIARALGELAPYAREQALPALREALGDGRLALGAAAALRRLGVPAGEVVPELLRLFDRCREEGIDPYGVAHEIAVFASPAAVPGLIRALRHPNPAVRPAAAWALCRVRAEDKDVVPALREALQDESAAGEAARSLQALREAK
jgi:HEAT repeat protein